MTKRQLIDEIVQINQTAQPGFLAQFEDADLNEYLEHLRVIRTPRLSGDARRFERHFVNCPTTGPDPCRPQATPPDNAEQTQYRPVSVVQKAPAEAADAAETKIGPQPASVAEQPAGPSAESPDNTPVDLSWEVEPAADETGVQSPLHQGVTEERIAAGDEGLIQEDFALDHQIADEENLQEPIAIAAGSQEASKSDPQTEKGNNEEESWLF